MPIIVFEKFGIFEVLHSHCYQRSDIFIYLSIVPCRKDSREEIFNYPSCVRRGEKGSKVGERWPFPAIDPTVERLILIRTYPDRETFLIDFPDTIINDK